jgi:hypothetical protein
MEKIAGIKMERDGHGKLRKVTFDMKYHAQFVEDYLDNLLIESRKNGKFSPIEEVKARLDKKFNVKTA